MKKCILSFILGGLIFFVAGASAAYVYTAKDIGYEPQDNTWNVANADQALTSLKEDLNNVNQNVTEYKQQITEALANQGVEVNENSSMQDITSGINNMGSTSVYYLGTGTSFDLKTILPNDYQSLTTDNFIIEFTSMENATHNTGSVNYYGSKGYMSSSGGSIGKSYSNGVLTISKNGLYVRCSADGGSGSSSTTFAINNPKVYLVLGSIENLN